MRCNPDKPWWYDYLIKNPNITWEIVRDNPRKPRWQYKLLSSNPNITWEIIIGDPDKRFDIVRDNSSDKPWDYEYLSLNPNITWEIVRDNPNIPWDYTKLSENQFKKHKHFKSKLPEVSQERKELINELYTKWGIPPNVDNTKPIFSKGGVHFWETWHSFECL